MDYLEHVAGITYHTARNWMKLADFAKKRPMDLDRAQTVRQAYVLAGLLPETEASDQQRARPQVWVQIERLTKSIETQISQSFESWSDTDRESLRLRLRPLVTLYERLEASTPPT